MLEDRFCRILREHGFCGKEGKEVCDLSRDACIIIKMLLKEEIKTIECPKCHARYYTDAKEEHIWTLGLEVCEYHIFVCPKCGHMRITSFAVEIMEVPEDKEFNVYKKVEVSG